MTAMEAYSKFYGGFARTFGHPLRNFFDRTTGFDITKFDEEIVKSGDGECLGMVKDRWGQEAADMVEALTEAM